MPLQPTTTDVATPAAVDPGPTTTAEPEPQPREAFMPKPGIEPYWAYVLGPVSVRGLHDTNAGAGVLYPGTWYLAKREERGWVHISDEEVTFEGWAPLTELHRADEIPESTVAAIQTAALRSRSTRQR